jgi:hypothetical protein
VIIQGNGIILIAIGWGFPFRCTGCRCNRAEASSDISIPPLPRNPFQERKSEVERAERKYRLLQNMPHAIQTNQPGTRNYLSLAQHGELSASHSRRPIPFRLKTMLLIVQTPRYKVFVQELTVAQLGTKFLAFTEHKIRFIVYKTPVLSSIGASSQPHRRAFRAAIRYTFFVLQFYLQSALVHSANCVKTYTVACRKVLSSAPL